MSGKDRCRDTPEHDQQVAEMRAGFCNDSRVLTYAMSASLHDTSAEQGKASAMTDLHGPQLSVSSEPSR